MILFLFLLVGVVHADQLASDSSNVQTPAAGDLFSQDAKCVDYHQGCMRVTWEQWRKSGNAEVCRQSCRNPCRFPGKQANSNAKPDEFNVATCEAQCVERQPISQLLKKHSDSKTKCIVIHYSGDAAEDKSPIEKEQFSYDDGMLFKSQLGDRAQKNAGGKCQWGDTPYNYQIDAYGNLIEGRSPDVRPDTNTRSELDTDGKINIEFDGDYRTMDEDGGKNCAPVSHDRLSQKQLNILVKTVNFLKHKYHTNYVTAHMWQANTDCPGDDVMNKLEAAGVLTGCPDDKHNPHKSQTNPANKCMSNSGVSR